MEREGGGGRKRDEESKRNIKREDSNSKDKRKDMRTER